MTTAIRISAVVKNTVVGHSLQSRCRRIRARRTLGNAPLHLPAYPFSPAELIRLNAYRLAVLAGFFSDWG